MLGLLFLGLSVVLFVCSFVLWSVSRERDRLKKEVQVLRGIRMPPPGYRMPRLGSSSSSYEWKVFVVAAPKQESVLVTLRKGSGDGIRIATVRVLDDDFDEQVAKAQARGEDRAATLNAAVNS